MKLFLTLFLLVPFVCAQPPAGVPAQAQPAPAAVAAAPMPRSADPAELAREQAELSRALSEAGASPVDYIRALEAHLAKYPDSPQRAVIEKALAKSAMDASDNARIIKYGEKVLASEKIDDLELLDKVIRALLDGGGADGAKKALDYAKRFENDVTKMRGTEPQAHLSAAQWSESLDRASARALVLEARATGNVGDAAQAIVLASESWRTWPNAEAAREKGWWLAKLGKNADAVECYAEAFTLEDPHSTEADRAQDRRRMGELYVKLHGSETGLGDLILHAYDETSAGMNARLADIRAKDPNAAASKVLDFVLPAVDGGAPLKIASLAGKTLVIDFWATWCGPCRVQHPMIEKVKAGLKNDPAVVFISVDTDDDHSLVQRFMHDEHWAGSAYFDAGLARLLNISSIPTVLVIDPKGRTSSRMTGFVPERFEDMLEHRIIEARQSGADAGPAATKPGN